MLRRIVLPMLAAATLAACFNDGPTAVSNGSVTAVVEGSAVRLTNKTSEPRAYMINDPEWLVLASLDLMALCTTADVACLRLPANGSVLVPFAEVGGYSTATKELSVWTWRVLPEGAGGALQAVMDEAITLKL